MSAPSAIARSGRLDHVALVYAQPDLAAERLGRILGLPVTQRRAPWAAGHPAIRLGQAWLEFLSIDHAEVGEGTREGLHHLGFTTADPAGTLAIFGATNESNPSGGLPGGLAGFLDASHTGGIRTHFVPDVGAEPDAQPGASSVERIDHLGVAAADNELYRAAFTERLGFPVESSQIDSEGRIAIESMASDKYGVVYHTRQPEWIGGLRALFITIGDCELECLQDYVMPSASVATRGAEEGTKKDQSAIARFVETRGPGLHHLAIKVDSIERALAHAADQGAVLLDERSRPGGRRSQIAFLHPKSAGNVLIHFEQRQPL